MIRKFLLSTTKMSGAVAIRAVTALLLNKLIATVAGPSGITLFSHLQNLLAIVIHLPQDGINKGYVKMFQTLPNEEKRRLLGQVFIFNFLVTTIPLLFIVVAQDFFWGRFGNLQSNTLIITFCIASLFIVWSITLLAHFQAMRKFGAFSLLTSVISVLILIGSGMFLYFGDSFQNFLIAYLVMQGLGFIVTYLAYYHYHDGGPIFSGKTLTLDKVKLLGEYILMALSVLLFTYMTDFFVRNYAIDIFGTIQTGLWQAVVRLSDYYKALFTVIVGAVFYTELTVRLTDKDSVKHYFRKILLLIAPTMALGLLLIFLLSSPILLLLFDEEFVIAERFLPYQLAGDFFGLISFLFAWLLMAEKRTLTFIIVQAGSTVCYLLLIWAFTPLFQIDGIVMAHFYRNIFFLLLVVLVNKRILI